MAWARSFSDTRQNQSLFGVFGMATAPDGAIYVSHNDGSRSLLHKLDTTGRELWQVPLTLTYDTSDGHVTDATSRYVYGLGNQSSQAGESTYVYRDTASGQEASAAASVPDGVGLRYAVSSEDDLLVDQVYPRNEQLSFTGADGSHWQLSTDGPNTSLQALAVDPVGNALVAGVSSGAWKIGDTPVPAGEFVVKILKSGQAQWLRSLGSAATVEAMGTTSAGTVVALAKVNGSLGWADSDVDPSADGQMALLVFEANGAPRFARKLPQSTTLLAVDPSGRAAVVGQVASSCGPVAQVIDFNLAGKRLWSTTLQASDCSDGLAPVAIGFCNHAVVVAGYASGANPYTDSHAPGPFVLELRP